MELRPIKLARGEIVGIQDTARRCVITQVLPGGMVGVRDCGSAQPPERVNVERLIHPPPAPAADGQGEAPSAPTEGGGTGREVVLVTAEDWEKAKRRLEIIRPLLDAHRLPGRVVKARAEEFGEHWTRLYAWKRAYLNGGGKLTALVDGQPSVPKGTKRLHPKIEALLQKCIDDHYLTKQRLRVSKVDDALKLACEEEDIPLKRVKGDKSRFYKPHINTLRARIRVVPPGKEAKERDGDGAASKHESWGGGFVASYPLEYLQIDHTQINVVLVNEESGHVLGRPWITVAIDVFSRMIVGYYVAFEAPGAIGTGLCLSQAILPKEEWLRERATAFGGKQPEWPCYGQPVCAHMDNAREFRGGMVKRAAEQYGVDVVFRPVKKPQYGAHIESLMDKLAEEFRTLPGATFSNPTERGKHYDSEAEAAVSLREFEDWLANHICCKYHYHPHSGLGDISPIRRWEQGMFEGTELAPALGSLPNRYVGEAAERLRLDFLPFEERVITGEGIVFEKIRYMEETLRHWINARDPKSGKKLKFLFRYDPRDLSFLYFWNPKLERYEAIPYRNRRLPAITLWELRAAHRYLLKERNLPEGLHHESMIFGAIKRNREIVAAALRRKGKTKAAGQFRPGAHQGRPKPGGLPSPIHLLSPGDGGPTSPAPAKRRTPTSGRDNIVPFDDREAC